MIPELENIIKTELLNDFIINDIYDIYDVGLIVNPSELSSIDIQIDNYSDENDFINLKENGNSIKFSIKWLS